MKPPNKTFISENSLRSPMHPDGFADLPTAARADVDAETLTAEISAKLASAQAAAKGFWQVLLPSSSLLLHLAD